MFSFFIITLCVSYQNCGTYIPNYPFSPYGVASPEPLADFNRLYNATNHSVLHFNNFGSPQEAHQVSTFTEKGNSGQPEYTKIVRTQKFYPYNNLQVEPMK